MKPRQSRVNVIAVFDCESSFQTCVAAPAAMKSNRAPLPLACSMRFGYSLMDFDIVTLSS